MGSSKDAQGTSSRCWNLRRGGASRSEGEGPGNRKAVFRVESWAMERGTYPNPEMTVLWIKFAGVPITLCQEARLAFLARGFGKVEAGSLRLVPEGRVNIIEALFHVVSPLSVL